MCFAILVLFDEFTRAEKRPTWQLMQNSIANWRLQRAIKSKDWKTVVSLLGTTMHYLHAEPYAADNALSTLVEAGCEAQGPVLKYGMKNADPQIRYMSMRVLGRIGDARCADAICNSLSSEDDSRVAACGAEALCLLGRTDKAKVLVERIFWKQNWKNGCDCQNDDIGILGHDIIPNFCNRTNVHSLEMAFYLNSRFKLGARVPSNLRDSSGAGLRWTKEAGEFRGTPW